jgi:hypothetical protein
MTQYLIQINHGPLKGETAWAVRNGDTFVRGSCTGFTIVYPANEVTVLKTRTI